MTRWTLTRRRGLSLIELIISLGLAMALLAAVFIFLQDLVQSRDRIEQLTTRSRAIDAYIDALDNALATSLLDSGDGGIVGDAISCTIHAATIDASRAVVAGGRPFPPSVPTWFGFEASDGSLQLRRGTGSMEALPAAAFALRFRYHDGAEWVDSFDSRARRRLPTAIEVSLWLAPWPEGAKPSWLPEDDVTDEPDGVEDGDIPLAAIFAPQSPLVGERSDDSDGTDEMADPLGEEDSLLGRSSREASEAIPVPDRRRIIALPDASPAELMPASRGGAR